MPKINANSLRIGNVIDHLGKLWQITKTQVVQPGKGGAFLAVELRDVRTGNKRDDRFRSSELVERVSLEDRDYTYLFQEGDNYTFMDKETFEQLPVPKDVIGYPAVFLQEGMEVVIKTFDGSPLSAELPQSVVVTVVEADPVVKGQTASSSYKPGILDNGERVMIPPHIEAGTKIVVATADGSYMERAKG
ncbi:elongation factor P [Zavarzinia sp. CC-PAN008]|uniref:elongation factor P n=1 Tax=Zavarzinia sp. CC-PAN008 TaxID=3243332 RepID=UPI003F74AA84